MVAARLRYHAGPQSNSIRLVGRRVRDGGRGVCDQAPAVGVLGLALLDERQERSNHRHHHPQRQCRQALRRQLFGDRIDLWMLEGSLDPDRRARGQGAGIFRMSQEFEIKGLGAGLKRVENQVSMLVENELKGSQRK